MLARLPWLVVLVALALAVAGCEGEGDAFRVGGGASVDPNATDAAFAGAIVPHQEQGAAIADLGQRRAKRVELRGMAKRILGSHGATIDELRAIAAELRRRGVRGRRGDMRRDPKAFDVARLRHAVSFDHQFMSMLIGHHEAAIAMAEEEQDRGADPRLKRLAGEVIRTQTRELEQLRRWLNTWYGGSVYPGFGGGGGGGGGEGEEPGGPGGEGPPGQPNPDGGGSEEGPPV